MPIAKREKKKPLQTASCQQDKIHGYQFQEDNYANQMAFLFGGAEGEKAAKRILEEAERQFPSPIQMVEKKKYIEDETKKRAHDIDTKFQRGIKDIFNTLQNKESPVVGVDAQKDTMLNLMKGLGLNIDDENVQTHYTPGPPKVFQVTWVNRPTENLKDENSNINQLANMYSNCLPTQEKEQFNNDWKEHKINAMNGGPKIEKSEFLKQADQSFYEKSGSLKNSESLMEPPADQPELWTSPSYNK